MRWIASFPRCPRVSLERPVRAGLGASAVEARIAGAGRHPLIQRLTRSHHMMLQAPVLQPLASPLPSLELRSANLPITNSGRLWLFRPSTPCGQHGALRRAVALGWHCQADPNRMERPASVDLTVALRPWFLSPLDVHSRPHGEIIANKAHMAALPGRAESTSLPVFAPSKTARRPSRFAAAALTL